MVGARSTGWLSIESRIENTMLTILERPIVPCRRAFLSVSFVWAFTLVSASLFVLAAAMLIRLTLWLAPVRSPA